MVIPTFVLRNLAPKEDEREQGSRLTRQTACERLRPQDQTEKLNDRAPITLILGSQILMPVMPIQNMDQSWLISHLHDLE